MHVRVTESHLCYAVDVGSLYEAAERGQLPVADVIEHEEKDVG